MTMMRKKKKKKMMMIQQQRNKNIGDLCKKVLFLSSPFAGEKTVGFHFGLSSL